MSQAKGDNQIRRLRPGSQQPHMIEHLGGIATGAGGEAADGRRPKAHGGRTQGGDCQLRLPRLQAPCGRGRQRSSVPPEWEEDSLKPGLHSGDVRPLQGLPRYHLPVGRNQRE